MNYLMQLWDQHPVAALVAFLFICYLIGRKRRQAAREAVPDPVPDVPSYEPSRSLAPSYSPEPSYRPVQHSLLSLPLFHWSPRDPFTIGDLLRGLICFGASGSGKSSGSLYVIAKAIAKCRKIGSLILASKPEDREFWQKVFRQAGRINDLIIFRPDMHWRFNFIDFIHKNGGDTKDITEAITVIGETLEEGENNYRDKFWEKEPKRLIHNSVEIVKLAKGRVTAPDLHDFITGAAMKPETVNTPEFKESLHGKYLRAAFHNAKTAIERHDFGIAFKYFKDEYPAMADKMRSGILTSVLGILHVFNSGIVRELVSTCTNVTPAVLDEGKCILVDMPISSDGAAGRFILAGMKHLTQKYILKRHAHEDTGAIVIFCDEYQKVANSGDPPFLAECRSHRGSMICATQSIHSLYTRIREAQEHGVDALLTNFYHKVYHALGDEKSAAYASSLIGRRLKTRVNVSSSGEDNAYDALHGQPKVTASTTQAVENILEPREFLQGMRTGGRAHGYVVDAWVVRSEAFASGENFLRCSFSQK
jgi:type IV secretory pathway TraG/TraD family ATPase VirD4